MTGILLAALAVAAVVAVVVGVCARRSTGRHRAGRRAAARAVAGGRHLAVRLIAELPGSGWQEHAATAPGVAAAVEAAERLADPVTARALWAQLSTDSAFALELDRLMDAAGGAR